MKDVIRRKKDKTWKKVEKSQKLGKSSIKTIKKVWQLQIAKNTKYGNNYFIWNNLFNKFYFLKNVLI